MKLIAGFLCGALVMGVGTYLWAAWYFSKTWR